MIPFGLGGMGLKIGIIVAVMAVAGAAYWHYTVVKAERDEAIALAGALQIANKVQDDTIKQLEQINKDWAASLNRFQTTLDTMATAQVEATEQQRKLNDVLGKHDLELLSLRKPGLVERRVNTGTADVLRMFECASGSGCDNDTGGS